MENLETRSNRKSLFLALRQWYIVVFFSYIMISRLLSVASVLPQLANSVLFLGFAGTGVVICGLGITVKDRKFLCLDNIFLMAFVLICAISSLLNMEYGFADNFKTVGWTFLQFILIYSFLWDMSLDEMKKEFHLLAKFLSVIWFAEVAVSLYQFLFQIGYIALNDQGKNVRQGFIDERLFGIFADPNYAGVTSVCVLIFSAYCIGRTANKAIRAFFYVNCVFQFLYIVLSGSRTAEIAGLITVFLFSWNFLRQKLRKKGKQKKVQNALSPILALLCCLVVFVAVDAVKTGMSYIPPMIGGNSANHTVDLHRPDVEDSTDISNLRFDIWKGALQIWTTKPVFGVSPRDFTTYAIERFPESFVAHRKYSVHNGYLALLVCTGIAGLLVMGAFIALILSRVWKYVMGRWNGTIPTFYILCLMILAAIAFSALTLQDIFFANSLNTNVFWLVLGYVSKMSMADRRKKTEKAGGTL